MTPAELINKARDNELGSYEVALCLREVERLNGAGTRSRLEIRSDESAAIFLCRTRPLHPDYTGKTVEDVLVAAYDALIKSFADDDAADTAHEALRATTQVFHSLDKIFRRTA